MMLQAAVISGAIARNRKECLGMSCLQPRVAIGRRADKILEWSGGVWFPVLEPDLAICWIPF